MVILDGEQGSGVQGDTPEFLSLTDDAITAWFRYILRVPTSILQISAFRSPVNHRL
jgi:hypothetical protein